MELSETLMQSIFLVCMLIFYFSNNKLIKNIIIFLKIILITVTLESLYGDFSYLLAILLIMSGQFIFINKNKKQKRTFQRISFLDYLLFFMLFIFVFLFVSIVQESYIQEFANLELVLFLMLLLLMTPLLEIADYD